MYRTLISKEQKLITQFFLCTNFNKYTILSIGHPYMMYNQGKHQRKKKPTTNNNDKKNKDHKTNTYFSIFRSVETFSVYLYHSKLLKITLGMIKFPHAWYPFEVV